eukprot:2586656-Pleurochrysis_carterae.AAC.1
MPTIRVQRYACILYACIAAVRHEQRVGWTWSDGHGSKLQLQLLSCNLTAAHASQASDKMSSVHLLPRLRSLALRACARHIGLLATLWSLKKKEYAVGRVPLALRAGKGEVVEAPLEIAPDGADAPRASFLASASSSEKLSSAALSFSY